LYIQIDTPHTFIEIAFNSSESEGEARGKVRITILHIVGGYQVQLDYDKILNRCLAVLTEQYSDVNTERQCSIFLSLFQFHQFFILQT
jgi:hypothetical protein